MKLRVKELRVWGFRIEGKDFGTEVQSFGFRDYGSGLRAQGVGCRV